MGKRLEETFHQRGESASKHINRCPTSLVVREILTKTTMKYLFTCTEMARVKKDHHDKCWQRYGELGTFIHFWCECMTVVQPLCKRGSFFESRSRVYRRIQRCHSQSPPKRHVTCAHTDTCPYSRQHNVYKAKSRGSPNVPQLANGYTKWGAFSNKSQQMLINTTIWMNLRNSTISERSKTQKIKSCICILYLHEISRKIDRDLQMSGCLGVKIGKVINCKLAQGLFWGSYKCSRTWLWSWLHKQVNLIKAIDVILHPIPF